MRTLNGLTGDLQVTGGADSPVVVSPAGPPTPMFLPDGSLRMVQQIALGFNGTYNLEGSSCIQVVTYSNGTAQLIYTCGTGGGSATYAKLYVTNEIQIPHGPVNPPTCNASSLWLNNGDGFFYGCNGFPSNTWYKLSYYSLVQVNSDGFFSSSTGINFKDGTSPAPVHFRDDGSGGLEADVDQNPAWNSSSAGYLVGSNVVQLPAPRKLNDKLKDSVSVKDYGAKCDGVADDWTLIMAAIAANPQGVINFPVGTCMISQPIVPTGNITLQGAGIDSSIVKLLPGSNCNAIQTTALTYEFTLSSFTVDGNWGTQSGAYSASSCLNLLGQFFLRSLRVQNCYGYGIWTNYSGGIADERFTAMNDVAVNRANLDGIRWGGSSDTSHIDVYVVDAGQASDNTYYSLNLDSGSADTHWFYFHAWDRGTGGKRPAYALYVGNSTGPVARFTSCEFEGGRQSAYIGSQGAIIESSRFGATFPLAPGDPLVVIASNYITIDQCEWFGNNSGFVPQNVMVQIGIPGLSSGPAVVYRITGIIDSSVGVVALNYVNDGGGEVFMRSAGSNSFSGSPSSGSRMELYTPVLAAGAKQFNGAGVSYDASLRNIGTGYNVLNVGNANGTDNVAGGYNSLPALSSGAGNTCSGSRSCQAVTSQGSMTCTGSSSCKAFNATSTCCATATGQSSLASHPGSNSLACHGTLCLTALTGGNHWAAYGANSLSTATGGSHNVGVGSESGTGVTGAASNCTFLGDGTGSSLGSTTLNNCIAIGQGALCSASNQLVISQGPATSTTASTGALSALPSFPAAFLPLTICSAGLCVAYKFPLYLP